jgi:hypothetical protein
MNTTSFSPFLVLKNNGEKEIRAEKALVKFTKSNSL